MMYRPPEDEIKKWEEIDPWYHFTKDGRYVLRDDAPEEVKKIEKELKKNSWDICES